MIGVIVVKRMFTWLFLIYGCALLLNNAYSTAYQPILGVAYENPAVLYTVKNTDIILGNTYIDSRFVFTGSNGPLTGRAVSDRNRNLPHGRVAYRVNPDLVIGLDVSHRVYINIQYPVGSILQSSSTASTMFDFDYSPRFSYKINDKLFVGAGANLNDLYSTQLNFVVEPFGNAVNKAGGWAYGWDAGIIYKFNEKTIANISYYSKITHASPGTSTWGAVTNKNLYFLNTIVPAEATVNIYKKMTEKLAMNVGFRYQFWNTVQDLNIINTALGENINIPLNYTNTWVSILNARYKFTDTVEGIIGSEYNNSPASLPYRYPGLPASSALATYIGTEVAVTKSCLVKLIYAHVFANPPINTVGRKGPIIGKESISDNIVDLFLIWHF